MKRYFPRHFDELNAIVAFTNQCFREEGIDQSLRNVVDLCVEELFVNMVTYNRETNADILLEVEPAAGGVRVSLTDYDVDHFDPRSAPQPDVKAPLEERTPGGLGLYLVMKMADEIHYEYRGRNSKITFLKYGNAPDV